MPATPSFGQGTPVTSRALNTTFSTLLAGDYDFSNIVATGNIKVNTNDYLSPYQGFRNKIINGDFRIWQRGTSLTGFAYTSDRWLAYNAAAVNTVSQQTASLDGFQYCARVQRNNAATSTGVNYLVQAVETSNSYSLQGKSATVSFWARKGANYSSASSLLGANLETGTGTDQNYISAWTGSVPTVGSFTLTASWQRFTVTGSVPSNATGVGVSFYYTPVGTAGAADYFEVTGVQLEEGSVATPFEHRPIGTELALCQRYYQKSYSLGVTVPTNNSQQGVVVGGAPSVANLAFVAHVKFPVVMRTTPTVSVLSYGLSQANRVSDAYFGTDQGANSGNPVYLGSTGFSVYNTSGVTMTSNLGFMFHYEAQAEL
jgi:hypothetical protein